MKLSTPVKIVIGLATAWFILYPFLFVAVWLVLAGNMFTAPHWALPEMGFPPFMGLFFAIFPLHIFTMLVQFVLIPFYLIHVIKNVAASETMRIVLGVGIFFMPFLAMPVYYYLYIWLDQAPVWALAEQGDALANSQEG